MNTTTCPQCSTILEVSSEELTECGVCAHQFTPMPSPSCESVSENGSIKKKLNVLNGKSAIVGCIACWLLGISFFIHSLGWFFVFLPLFLASFALAIAAVVQSRVWLGVTMLIANLIGSPFVGFVRYIVYPKSAATTAVHATEKSSVQIVEWSVTPGKKSSTGSMKAEWKIHLRNDSNSQQIGGVWLHGYDKDGFECYENLHEVVTVIPAGGELKVISKPFFMPGEYEKIKKFSMSWR